MVPGGRTLIDISYKYNTWNVIHFIVTVNAGKTQAVLTYFCKYLYQFNNFPVTLLLVPI